MKERLAVVIPALDEARLLPRLLEQLRAQRGVSLEIIVADGGSSDRTAAIAGAAGAIVVSAPRGRATQMNAGARAATAGFLLFLHADSELREAELLANALSVLERERVEPGGHRVAGHFPLRFAGGAPEHATFYRHVEGKTRLNRPHTINGDQGFLIAREFFDELGGYDERLGFLEDQRIAAKIFERGRWIVLPGELVTSARRFETEGVRERYTLMALIMALHAGGADPFLQRLPQIYPPHRESGRLELTSFLDAIEAHLRELGLRRRWKLLLRIGRFIRENAWQLAYRRDLLAGDAQHLRLRRHDRHLQPLLDHAAADALAAILARLWFLSLRRREKRPVR